MAKETLPEKQARLKASACLWAESLYIYELIARAVGIDNKTLSNWRNDDEEFSNRLEQSRMEFIKRNLRKAKPEFALERAAHEYFKQRTESDVKLELPQPILNGLSVKDKNGT